MTVKKCHTCDGDRRRRFNDPKTGKGQPCPTCNGTGEVEHDYASRVVNKTPMYLQTFE